MRRLLLIATVLLAGGILVPPASAAPSYKNCTELQKTYPHGIGRANARDKTSGRPVTTFRKDTPGYERAMRANPGLDRDKDAIACEKH